jgi:hypothetical protein
MEAQTMEAAAGINGLTKMPTTKAKTARTIATVLRMLPAWVGGAWKAVWYGMGGIWP